MPKETCEVRELLDQIGVPYERDTEIQCYAQPGMNIDYLVTVGVSINEIPRDIVSVAESTMHKQQEQQQRQQIVQQNQVTVANVVRTVQKPVVLNAQSPKVQAAAQVNDMIDRKRDFCFVAFI